MKSLGKHSKSIMYHPLPLQITWYCQKLLQLSKNQVSVADTCIEVQSIGLTL